MSKYRFEEVPDEQAMSPVVINQFAGWAKGYSYYGAPINPVMDDDDEYNSFQNTGLGGSLGIRTREKLLSFWAQSASDGPPPATGAFATDVLLYGPGGQPLVTREKAETLKNKNLDNTNTIAAEAITSGTINAARLPVTSQCCVVKNTVTQDFADGTWTVTAWNTLIRQTTGVTMWTSGANASRITLPLAGFWLFVCQFAMDEVQQGEGYVRPEFRMNGTTNLGWVNPVGDPNGNSIMGGGMVTPHWTSSTNEYVEVRFNTNNGAGTNDHRMRADGRFAAFFMGP